MRQTVFPYDEPLNSGLKSEMYNSGKMEKYGWAKRLMENAI